MNANKTKFSLILACGLALAAGPVVSANDVRDEFRMLDTDGDGRISRTEHLLGAQASFNRVDANSDGVITLAEMDATHDLQKTSRLKFWDKQDQRSASEKMRPVDLNNDGQLTRAENETTAETMFARMDTDNDGYLSKEECEKGHKQMEKQSGR